MSELLAGAWSWIVKGGRWLLLLLAGLLSVIAPLWYLERRRRKRTELQLESERRAALAARRAAELEANNADRERQIGRRLRSELEALTRQRAAARLKFQALREELAASGSDLEDLAELWNDTAELDG